MGTDKKQITLSWASTSAVAWPHAITFAQWPCADMCCSRHNLVWHPLLFTTMSQGPVMGFRTPILPTPAGLAPFAAVITLSDASGSHVQDTFSRTQHYHVHSSCPPFASFHDNQHPCQQPVSPTSSSSQIPVTLTCGIRTSSFLSPAPLATLHRTPAYLVNASL